MLIKALLLTSLATAGVALAGWELWARRMIRGLRADFQWLITEQDESPHLDPNGLAKFVADGYDPELGWVRKPNTSGTERSRGVPMPWSVDGIGARSDPYSEDRPVAVVAMGDSYTFSRQVEDGDAWPALLGKITGVRVANFGVGNYGLDQAILRYRREGRIPGAKIAILGVVPETITRVHSAWKHYSEYGNTFAFKPRFRLSGGRLEMLPNVITEPGLFGCYHQFLPVLRDRDYFYESKFRHDMIRSPYLWHWLSKPRNRRLVALLRERNLRRKRGNCDDAMEAAPFRSVMERNLRLAAAMYGEGECRALFKALVLLFAQEVRAAGVEPVFAMFPQLLDLQCFGVTQPYQPVMKELGESLLVVDGAEILSGDDMAGLYAEDSFGGHYSAQGNSAVAGLMARHIQPFLDLAEARREPRPAIG